MIGVLADLAFDSGFGDLAANPAEDGHFLQYTGERSRWKEVEAQPLCVLREPHSQCSRRYAGEALRGNDEREGATDPQAVQGAEQNGKPKIGHATQRESESLLKTWNQLLVGVRHELEPDVRWIADCAVEQIIRGSGPRDCAIHEDSTANTDLLECDRAPRRLFYDGLDRDCVIDRLEKSGVSRQASQERSIARARFEEPQASTTRQFGDSVKAMVNERIWGVEATTQLLRCHFGTGLHERSSIKPDRAQAPLRRRSRAL
jgi:hypothetical protein